MDPELRGMFEESLALAKENNKMLRAMRKSQKLAQLLRGLYWVLIIASMVAAYYFIQPYIDTVTNAYSNSKGLIDSIKNIGGGENTAQIEDLMKTLQGN